MKTTSIKVTRSYSEKIRESLAGLGYEIVNNKVIVGNADCRNFETLDEVLSAFDEKTLVQYVNEKVHVLDKEKFSQSILEKEGLKEVSVSKMSVATKDARKFWAINTGQKNTPEMDLEAKCKTASGVITFDEVLAIMIEE